MRYTSAQRRPDALMHRHSRLMPKGMPETVVQGMREALVAQFTAAHAGDAARLLCLSTNVAERRSRVFCAAKVSTARRFSRGQKGITDCVGPIRGTSRENAPMMLECGSWANSEWRPCFGHICRRPQTRTFCLGKTTETVRSFYTGVRSFCS